MARCHSVREREARLSPRVRAPDQRRPCPLPHPLSAVPSQPFVDLGNLIAQMRHFPRERLGFPSPDYSSASVPWGCRAWAPTGRAAGQDRMPIGSDLRSILDSPSHYRVQEIPSVDPRQQVKLPPSARARGKGKCALEDLDRAGVLTMGPVICLERGSGKHRVPTGEGR